MRDHTYKKLVVALAVSLLSEPIHGAIIYSGAQNEAVAHFSGDSLSFQVRGNAGSLTVSDSRGAFVLEGVSSFSSYSTLIDPAGSRNVAAFDEGFEIGSSDGWVRPSVQFLFARYDPDDHPRMGHFRDKSNKFMAIKILDDNDELFGWVRASHSIEAEEFIIHDWAWNSTPGEPILAGEIPEPAVAGLLAGLFSIGGAFYLRRRRAGREPEGG